MSSSQIPQAPVVDDLVALIGNTPLIRLPRIEQAHGPCAAIWAKCEFKNPGGSVKDRIALAMIEAAEREGRIHPGVTTLVEPTSGNTGIGLALVARVKGYKLVLTMPESMSLERRKLLAAYGATLELTRAEEAMEGAVRRAELLADLPNHAMLQQFENPANPDAHRRTTAPELLAQMGDRRIDAFVAAVGTGGTITGVGQVLRAHNPATRVIAVEPDASPVLSGGDPGPHKIQGIGAGFVPPVLDRAVYQQIERVRDDEAMRMKRALARSEGLLVGISSGANVVAAVRAAQRLGPDAHVVTVLCDTGERYFSLDEYFPEPSTADDSAES